MFLAIATAVFVVLLLASAPRRARAALPGLVAGALVAVVLTVPYALPYLANARTLGPRSPGASRGIQRDAARLSRQPASELAMGLDCG